MALLRFTCSFPFLLLSCALPSAQPAKSLGRIDEVVNAAIERRERPGAVVLILHRREVVYKKAIGHRVLVPKPPRVYEARSAGSPVNLGERYSTCN